MADSTQTTPPDGPTPAQLRARKAAATRKRNAAVKAARRTRGDARRTTTSVRTTARGAGSAASATSRVRVQQAAQLAERAVLVPVGASLLVRDNIVSTVTSIADRFGSRASVGRELERYERRGASARRGLETQVRRTGSSVQREVKSARDRISSIAP